MRIMNHTKDQSHVWQIAGHLSKACFCAGLDSLPSAAIDPTALAEAMPPSAKAFEQMAPPVQPIAAGTPYEVPTTKSTSPRLVLF